MENIRWIILVLSIITIFLHINIWVSENGYQRIRSLSSQINDQRKINQVLRDRNNGNKYWLMFQHVNMMGEPVPYTSY